MSWKKLLRKSKFLMEELGQIYHDKSIDPEDFKRLRNEVLYFHDQVEFIYETTHRMSRSFIISLISFIVYLIFVFFLSTSIVLNTLSIGISLFFILNSFVVGYEVYLTMRLVKQYQTIMRDKVKYVNYYEYLCEEIGSSILEYGRSDK